MNKQLKIAVFHLAFFYSGGGEKLVLEEIIGLRKRGHEVDCYSPVVEKWLCFPGLISGLRVKTIFPRLPRIIKHQETIEIIISCLLFPFIAWKFRGYDVVFAANQPSPWFAWLVKKFTGTPYVIYLSQPTRILYPRQIDVKEGFWMKNQLRIFPTLVKLTRPFIVWIDSFSIKGADQRLGDGEYMTSVLQRTYKEKFIVCPAGTHISNIIARDRFSGLVKANGFEIKKPYILLTNRHFPHKRFEYAIRSMPLVLKKHPNTKLIITGNSTKYTKELKQMVDKFSIKNSVIFTGFISEKDLSKLYTNACLYVYTSPEEDFGMGVIESMGAGVPVIAWNKAGPSTTIVNGRTGLLVKPYSQRQFTNKIIYLLKEKEKNNRMGRNAYKHAKNNYTYKKHNQLLEKTLIKYSKKDG